MPYLPSVSSDGGKPENIQCSFCTRLHDESSPGNPTCDAFPDGIPQEILLNELDHREPHPDDNGLQIDFGSRSGG